MTLAGRALLVGGFLVSSVIVNACVGDDPSPSVTPDNDGGPSGNDAGQPNNGNDSGPAVDGGGDDSGNGASCDGGLMCNAVCTDVSTSAKNCGRCDHDCGGTAKCTAGVCEAQKVAGAATDDNITSLTTDQTDDNPKGVALKIFWSVTGAGGGIFQDNATGGNKLSLSTTAAAPKTNVVVSGGSAHWFGRNLGGSPQPVLKGTVGVAGTTGTSVGTMNAPFLQSILYDAVNKNVLGSYSVNATMHGAFKCPGAGGACTSMTTFGGSTGGNVATDLDRLYFCGPDDGLILYTTLNGGSSGTAFSAQDTPNLLRVDGANLYWSNAGTKTIQRGPFGGGTVKQMASTINEANAIAADAVNVYWTDNTTGTLNYAPVTGAGPNKAYVTLGAATNPMRLVRDKNFLYFTHKGSIHRVALP